jgi:mRNA interferase RelE/StbE
MYRVILHRDADKDYRGFDTKLKARTDRAINDIRLSPCHGPNIKKLKGKLSNLYRYRIGGFRILYEIVEDIKTVRVKTIEARGKVYK